MELVVTDLQAKIQQMKKFYNTVKQIPMQQLVWHIFSATTGKLHINQKYRSLNNDHRNQELW